MKVCIKCGTSCSDDGRFCVKCGTALTETPAEGAGAAEPILVGASAHDGGVAVTNVQGAGVPSANLPTTGVVSGNISVPSDNLGNGMVNPTWQSGQGGAVAAKKGLSKKAVIAIVLSATIFIVAAFTGLLLYLNYTFSPDRTIERFVSAVQLQNSDYLSQNLFNEDQTMVSSTDLLTFYAGFTDSNYPEELTAHLKMLASGKGRNAKYDSIYIKTVPKFLGYNDYYIMLKPITIKIKAPLKNSVITLNGQDWGVDSSGEITVTAKAGVNNIGGSYKNEYTSLEAATRSITSYSSSVPTMVSLTMDYIDGKVNTGSYEDVVVYVNDVKTNLSASGGLVLLGPVAKGTIVLGEYTYDGKKYRSKVVINGDTVPKFSFTVDKKTVSTTEKKQADPPKSNQSDSDSLEYAVIKKEINDYVLPTMRNYYVSYLNTINFLDMSYLEYSTGANRTTTRKRIEDKNMDYVFDFKSMVVDLNSVSYKTKGGIKTVTFNAKFSYSYRYRDSYTWHSGSNTQKCTLVFDNGQNCWLVNSHPIVKNITLSGNRKTFY